jgi:hypothetical protein
MEVGPENFKLVFSQRSLVEAVARRSGSGPFSLQPLSCLGSIATDTVEIAENCPSSGERLLFVWCECTGKETSRAGQSRAVGAAEQ